MLASLPCPVDVIDRGRASRKPCLDVLAALGAELAELNVVSYIACMSTPVFPIDRVLYAARAAMVGVIAEHLEHGVVVQVEDSTRPRSMRLCYEIWPVDGAYRLYSTNGRRIGIYASVAALIDHAETVTGT